jgi:hypothetical protein
MKTKMKFSIILSCLLFCILNSAHAFYNPGTGRWMSRDPIGERGGQNVVAFLANAGLGRWDALGHSSSSDVKRLEYASVEVIITACISSENPCRGDQINESLSMDYNDSSGPSYVQQANFYFNGTRIGYDNYSLDADNWGHFQLNYSFSPVACLQGQVGGTDTFSARRDSQTAIEFSVRITWSYECNSCCGVQHPLSATFAWNFFPPYIIPK